MSLKNDFIKLAQSQVGYKETGTNRTKYSNYFDTTAWQWFNTKKNGNPGTPWCAIFVCWLFSQNCILGPKKALTFLGCPAPKNNCAAGAPYLYGYLKKKGWEVDKKSGQAGDVIFFNVKNAKGQTVKNGHVGIIEKVQDGSYKAIEGNKSNAVKRGSYKIGSASVSAICRPKWSQVEPTPAPEPTPTPTPAPTPTPTPAPTKTKYKVKTNSGAPLALRSAPKKKAACLVWMKNGTILTVDKMVKGDAVNGNTSWAHTSCSGYTGYASAEYLKKI